MKPLDTALTKSARTFVENPVYDFLRTLAETGVLPEGEDLPNDDNPYPISQWPQVAAAIPRNTLGKMFRDSTRGTLDRNRAGKLLSQALSQYPRGIPDTFGMNTFRRWKMANDRNDVYELRDRAFCLPDIAELRERVEAQAGEAIDWSAIDTSAAPMAGVVVGFPGAAKKDDAPQF
jgi:hypothetical protein